MTAASLLSSALGFGAILTLAFSLPNTDDLILNSPPGSHPLLLTLLQTTTYFGLTTVMATVLIVLIVGASISALATSSRHIVAFSRDSGLPFASIWMHVTTARVPGTEAPINAFALSLITTLVLALANLGIRDNTLSFSLSLAVVFMATGYIILLISVLHRRLHGNVDGSRTEPGTGGEGLPVAKWSLGFWAAPVNVVATGYVLFVFTMAFFPLGLKDLQPNTLNWTGLVWLVVALFTTGLYVLHGQYVYRLPVRSRSVAEELETSAEVSDQSAYAAPSPNV
jgi:choline transport protein